LKGELLMKKYRVTVNGQSYEVEVEELGGEAPVAASIETKPSVETKPSNESTPKQQPKMENPKPAAEPKPAAAVPAGKISVTSPMPGTILSIKTRPGTQVAKGDVLMILEAMKMENEILAPQDGKVASIEIAEGASVNTGDLLAVIE
jgi:biotin carboxyl carrier protein